MNSLLSISLSISMAISIEALQSPSNDYEWIEIATEAAGDQGTNNKWRFLDFGSEIYAQYDEITEYKLEWGANYENIVVFELGAAAKTANHHIFENTAISVNANIKINILQSNVQGLPIATDQYFCKACASSHGTRPGDTCWAILDKSDANRGCGCNSGGWTGNGAYYGGWVSGQCKQCDCWGGGFAGYKTNGQQKGAISSVGIRLSIKVSVENRGCYWYGDKVMVVYQTINSLTVDMSYSNRPDAYGTYDENTNTAELTFPDDQTYSVSFDQTNGFLIFDELQQPHYWAKSTDPHAPSDTETKCNTLMNIAGCYWYGPETMMVSRYGNTLSVDMSNTNRPNAYGKYNFATQTGTLTFPDDKTYQISFEPQQPATNGYLRFIELPQPHYWAKSADPNAHLHDTETKCQALQTKNDQKGFQIPILKCEIEESYVRATAALACDIGDEMHEGLCYDPCASGYFSATGFVCIEYCPSGYIQVGLTCTKENYCDSCHQVCTPKFDCYEVCVPLVGCHEVCVPDGFDCHDVCVPYLCPDVKTVDTYVRQPSFPTTCPSGYENTGVLCYEECSDGFSEILGGGISCVCDVISFAIELMSFIDNLKEILHTELNDLLYILQPLLEKDPQELIEMDQNEAKQLIDPYMNEIAAFIDSVQSQLSDGRRRLTGATTSDSGVIGFELTAGAHEGEGRTIAVGVTKPSEQNNFEYPTTYWGHCSGVVTDNEGGVAIAIVIYKEIDSIPGDSKVIGSGGDLFDVISGDVFVILGEDHNEFLGVGLSVGGGLGIMPAEGNYHSCTAEYI